MDQSPYSGERVLILERNLFTQPCELTRLFAQIHYLNPRTDLSKLSVNTLRQAGFDRIVFANPMGKDAYRNLYHDVRHSDFPMLICERGSLPGTVFLDPMGFLADSSLYQAPEDIHDQNIDAAAQLAQLRHRYFNRPTLEPETGGNLKRSDSPVSNGKPIVLFVLQDTADTAVKHFSGPGGDYPTFLKFCAELAKSRRNDFQFLYRPHPRNPDTIVNHASPAPDQNMTEAVQQATFIITYTSGVGFISNLLERPVGFFGRPFYASSPWAETVDTLDRFDQWTSKNTKQKDLAPLAHYVTHVSNLYSDATFFGRKRKQGQLSPGFNHDISCIYTSIVVHKDGQRYTLSGHHDEAPGLQSHITRSLTRVIQNRLNLGYYDIGS